MTRARRGARDRLGTRALAVGLGGLAVVVAVAATPQLLGTRIDAAFAQLSDASPPWLWLAALGFLCSLMGSAASWHAAIRASGGHLTLLDANARYGAGSLVNTFVPARAGDAVRFALFSRAIDSRHRLLATGGGAAAVGAARSLSLALLVAVGAATGALPLWPLALLGGAFALAVAIAWRVRGREARSRAAHLLDAFRALGAEPQRGLAILGGAFLAMAGRIVSAAAAAAALGVHPALAAALLIVPALELTGLLPLTPGNVGITTGTVALALQAHGIGPTAALSTGIAFHAIETGVSLVYGLCGLPLVALASSGTGRRVSVVVTATAGIVLAAGIGATLIEPLF